MKAYLLALLMLFVIIGFSKAQTSQNPDSSSISKDPQVSEQNYKHPNKASEAVKSGKNKHVKTTMIQKDDNSNYKQSFKKRTTHKSKVATEAHESGKKDKRNYKNQFH